SPVEHVPAASAYQNASAELYTEPHPVSPLPAAAPTSALPSFSPSSSRTPTASQTASYPGSKNMSIAASTISTAISAQSRYMFASVFPSFVLTYKYLQQD
ncbi:hypothetical protein GDO86_001274, partial [Hymenochirus boettgeri]